MQYSAKLASKKKKNWRYPKAKKGQKVTTSWKVKHT